MAEPTYKQIINHTIIDDLDILGDLNQAYIPISKDQTPAVVDPTGKTGKLYNASIETIMTQQLNDKLKDNTHLGDMCYNAGLMEDSDFGLADGQTEYSLETEPQYYNWLLLQPQNVKDKHLLNTTAQTFRLPNYQEKDIGKLNFHLLPSSFHYFHAYSPDDGGNPSYYIKTTPYVLIGYDRYITFGQNNSNPNPSKYNQELYNIILSSNDSIKDFFDFSKVSPEDVNLITPEFQNLVKTPLSYCSEFVNVSSWDVLKQYGTPSFTNVGMNGNLTNLTSFAPFTYMELAPLQYIYIRLRISKSYTTNNYVDKGLGEMSLGYTATKLNQVITKKDLINGFIDYEIPVAFTLNDIGKIFAYYHKAEQNPSLISLDGTRYLITDYPNFDFANITNSEGGQLFNSDGIYFWFQQLSPKIIEKTSASDYSQDLCYHPLNGGEVLSKYLYNWLNLAGNESFLGEEFYHFKILNASSFQIKLPNLNTSFQNNPILWTNGLNMLKGNILNAGNGTINADTIPNPKFIQIKPDYMIARFQKIGNNDLLKKVSNKLGTIIFHPAPAGYQNIPSEINGFGDAVLVADGRLIDKVDYPDMWDFIQVRKNNNIYGFNGETLESFKIDDLTNKITLPNLLSSKAVYMGNYGVQEAIFPQHTFTSGSITPTTQPHSHTVGIMTIENSGGGAAGGNGYKYIYPTRTSSSTTVAINPFTVSSSKISNLPAGVTIGADYKVAGIKMIPCIVCKPTYDINAGSGGSGGGVATEDLNMNLFKITNLGVPVSDSDAVRLVDLKLDNNKILYKKNSIGGYDSLQNSMDILFLLTENSVNKNTGLMDSSYDITKITQPKNIITLEYLENSNTINGYIKKDRSIGLTGTGTPFTDEPTAMNDLKAENIIYSDVVADEVIADETKAKTITTLKTKLDTIDTSISNGSNDISALQTLVNDLKTKLDSYDTKYRSFTSKFVKSGLSVTINSNNTNLTNLTQYFRASQNPVITSFGSSISGLPLGAINLIEVGTGANQGFKFPIIDGIVNANLTFTIRVTGAISGNAGTPRELIVYLRRVSDNSLVANGGIVKVNDNNFNARSVIVPSFIQGANDPFYTGGFYLDLLNRSGGDLQLTSLELLIQG